MNTNRKKLSLLSGGLSAKLVHSLTESEINILYKKILESKKESKEAITTKSSIESTKYTAPEVAAMKSKGQGLKVNGEVLPTPDGGIEVIKRTGTAGSETTEGLDIEMTEKFESKAQQKYFWAKCNRSKGKEKAKWCKMAEEFSEKTSKKDYKKMPEKKHTEKTVKYKKENKEGAYNDLLVNSVANQYMGKLRGPSVLFPEHKSLEKRIGQIIEKHLNPKMTKRDLIKLVSETELAPEKEKTKEREKTKTPSKPKHDNPYKPKPGVKPAPKAETKEQSPTIAPPKPKTPVKPSKPFTPYRPKPGVKPAPKATKDNIPNWLTFNEIGINIK